MSMYVLQVLTGQETEIRKCLRDCGIEAHVPQEERRIRTGGRWITRLYTLIPSYIFVELANIGVDYYRLRRITGVIRLLELNGGEATALTAPEEKFIRSLCSEDRPAPVSTVWVENGRITPLDGPLKLYADARYPIRYNLHQRRALIYTIESIGRKVILSFDVKSPTTAGG